LTGAKRFPCAAFFAAMIIAIYFKQESESVMVNQDRNVSQVGGWVGQAGAAIAGMAAPKQDNIPEILETVGNQISETMKLSTLIASALRGHGGICQDQKAQPPQTDCVRSNLENKREDLSFVLDNLRDAARALGI